MIYITSTLLVGVVINYISHKFKGLNWEQKQQQCTRGKNLSVSAKTLVNNKILSYDYNYLPLPVWSRWKILIVRDRLLSGTLLPPVSNPSSTKPSDIPLLQAQRALATLDTACAARVWNSDDGSTACRRSFMLCQMVYVHACSLSVLLLLLCVCVSSRRKVASCSRAWVYVRTTVCMRASMHAHMCGCVHVWGHVIRLSLCVCVSLSYMCVRVHVGAWVYASVSCY